jgi:hypothetical protein
MLQRHHMYLDRAELVGHGRQSSLTHMVGSVVGYLAYEAPLDTDGGEKAVCVRVQNPNHILVGLGAQTTCTDHQHRPPTTVHNTECRTYSPRWFHLEPPSAALSSALLWPINRQGLTQAPGRIQIATTKTPNVVSSWRL